MPLLAVRGNAAVGSYGFGASVGKASAMTAIASTTLGSATATVTFSSIPTTYDDLYLVGYRIGDAFNFRLNNDFSSIYSETILYGDGGAAYSTRGSSQSEFSYLGDNGNTTTPGAFVIHIINYSTSSYNKSYLGRTSYDINGVGGQTRLVAGLYRSNTQVTRLDLNASGTFSTGSVFSLYGIKKAV